MKDIINTIHTSIYHANTIDDCQRQDLLAVLTKDQHGRYAVRIGGFSPLPGEAYENHRSSAARRIADHGTSLPQMFVEYFFPGVVGSDYHCPGPDERHQWRDYPLEC